MTNEDKIKEVVEETIKQACIEAQNNKFITPIVFRQSIKLTEKLSTLVGEVAEDICKITDEIELNREGDTKEWMLFKQIRNTIRDKYVLNELKGGEGK